MPLTHHIDPARNIVIIQMEGAVTTDDFVAFFDRTDRDPAYHAHLDRIVVALEATEFPSSEDLRALARQVGMRVGPDARIAVVARSPLAVGIMAMMVGGAGLSNRYQVFTEVGAAEDWLAKASEDEWREFLDRTQPPRRRTPAKPQERRASAPAFAPYRRHD